MTGPSAEAWRALADGTAPTRGEFRVFETPVASAEGPALLAIDSSGLRHVLIPIRSGVAVEPDQKSSGVHILGRVLVDNAIESSFVDVICRKEHLAEVFGYLADELLLELAREPGRPSTVAKRTLNRWRELIERERPNILSTEELAGLFGELWLLKQLARESASAVDSWTGPLGARFDFQRALTAVEVKTSLSRQSAVVHIHGVDQLDPPSSQELYLFAISLETPAATGTSVPSLIGEIRVLGVDLSAFSSKLHAAGFAIEDAAYYDDIRFLVTAERAFHVNDTFPRITKSSFVGGTVPARVSNVRYSLDLSTPPPSPLSTAESRDVCRRLVPA